MGKRGRAKKNRREAESATATSSKIPPEEVGYPQVHVTVATMPRSDISGSLAHDAALVKAALLYADHVTLASPNAIMLAGVAGLTLPDSQDPARRADGDGLSTAWLGGRGGPLRRPEAQAQDAVEG